jgi:hypothetical protein
VISLSLGGLPFGNQSVVLIYPSKRVPAEIGDHLIGQRLSRAPSGESGHWPCRPACEVMEHIASEDIGIAFRLGVLNARGATRADPGGIRPSGELRRGSGAV